MSELQTDKEQIEILKKIWKKYSVPIGLAVVLVFGGIYGVNYFKKMQVDKVESASVLYQDLLDLYLSSGPKSDSEKDYDTLNQIVASLANDYGESIYTQFAMLFQAKWLLEQNLKDRSVKVLEQLISMPTISEVDSIARMRLGRVLLSYKTAAQAEKTLNILDAALSLTPNFAASFYELRGDALLALNKRAEAKSAYQNSLNAHMMRGSNEVLVQMKLDDLANVESGKAASDDEGNEDQSA